MTFNWMFAIIVGVVFLFLAIYGVVKFINVGESVVSTESSAELVNILNNYGSIGSGIFNSINFDKDVEIYFDCDFLSNRPFGMQEVRFSERGEGIEFYDKYVFAEKLEGKKIYLFSKPFELGYKVGDLVMISSEEYCFKGFPDYIKDEIDDAENIGFGDCSGVEVCFGSSGCEIDVIEIENGLGKVMKGSEELYYIDNLVFGAIFSSSENYECNVQRLKNRFNELVLIYKKKIELLEDKKCNSKLDVKIDLMRSKYVGSSEDLVDLKNLIDEIEEINNVQSEGCEVW